MTTLGPASKATHAPSTSGIPVAGDVVLVRHRQYLVEDVVPPPHRGDLTLVRCVCLDDDAQGRRLEVLWELELGARVIEPRAHGLGDPGHLDPPRHFAAYLHALKWSCVTATDPRLFQAPFRAGIQLLNHQLTPLKKALELPRVNLFIADDVGLGKTIEAGLVLQELLLRQRIDYVLVVCPASVALQWRDEMERRFGLRFDVVNRAFVARRRQERGFGVNPWTTGNRFVVSYQTLRRPEYRDGLLQHLGSRLRKSLLILDEAHTVAPASASKYAIDSRLTRAVRDLAPRFENRLFLSATPHNGHSNSFSSLLEILDPQRFTRGVPVRNAKQLEPIMVRRLKGDLRALGLEFPERRVIEVDLTHDGTGWEARFLTNGASAPAKPLGTGEPAELALARLLAEYTALRCPARGSGRLVFLNLQKRLLSSIEAFHRTLRLHAEHLGRAATTSPAPQAQLDFDEDDVADEVLEERDASLVAASSRELPSAEGRAATLLDEMLRLSAAHRAAPDAKARALVAWIREHLCPGANVDGLPPRGAARKWSDRRVIVFTEFGDTKRWLLGILRGAIEGTEDADRRILTIQGGMSEEARASVQAAFNAPPDEHPVRILLATDAAREGINLQAYCADLFHFDVPWNPARMEQRNGRIDRTLQPSPEVRCHYFFYPQRSEDVVLRTLVEKVDRIGRQLGSLGEVVMNRLSIALEDGIDADAPRRLDRAVEVRGLDTVKAELESQRAIDRLEKEIGTAGRILEASRSVMDFDPVLLRDAIDVGCALAGAGPLKETEGRDGDRVVPAFALPELPDSWAGTLDTLRPPRDRDESFWEWRKRPPQPVVFKAPERIDGSLVHLHLSHPFVQRILSRFTAQGFSAHDLSRVTVVRSEADHVARVLAFARLSLFGAGAVRLHDEVISVAAAWNERGGTRHLRPFADQADRRALERLEETLRRAPDLEAVPERVRERLLASAPGDFAVLWEHLEKEADRRAADARRRLAARGEAEAAALRRILEEQRTAIEKTLVNRAQLELDLSFQANEREQRDQFEADRRHMESRLGAIEREIEEEPVAVARGYEVALVRVVPVGLIYLWPGTR